MGLKTVAPWLRTVLAAAGVFVAAVLSGTRLLDLDLPCGGGGCEAVGSSALASPGGVPLAYVGFAFYLTLFGLSAADLLGVGRDRPKRWCDGLTTVGAAVSLALTGYSILILRTTCAWCLASASIALFLFAIAPWCKPLPAFSDASDRVRLLLLAVAPLAFAVFYLEGLSASSESVPFDAVTVRHLPREAWTRTGMPELGSSNAGRRLILFGDVACGGCRSVVRKILQRQGRRTGWIFSFRHLLPHPDPDEKRAAALLETAAERRRFWEAWSLAAQGGGRLGDVESAMMRLSLPDEPSRSAIRHVQDDRDLTRFLGFRQTPTLVVLETGREARVVGPRVALRLLEGVSERNRGSSSTGDSGRRRG